ncbi:efflux RND transporter periplasmic adaptor subunit [uncultured Sanguibacteroides sp.]|uniref:efflux RND transporter periplasmic adaptor subunit n=1 Tax=uncultured Sanguibacteroides sp. TaxID=1635151 RepID=UPI0025CC5DCE|nr:efflux RND transporter periplasmic adaptor subunit [uncultured Sanguibacteroides sp.]
MINKNMKYIGFILLAFALNGCNNQRMGSGSENPTPVWLSEVGKRTIRQLTTTTGTAKASQKAEVKSEVTGKYILQTNPKTGRPYKLGDIVEKGAVIIRLENKDQEISVSLETKEMDLKIKEKEVAGNEILLEKGGVTEKDLLTSKSGLVSARLGVEKAKMDLDKLNIRAPFKGVIVNLPYYTPNVDVASNEVLLGIMDYSKMYMEIELPESTIEKVKVGQKVLVTNYNIKSDTLSGHVTQLSPAINEETRTFSGFITIDNPDLKLRPGMFAKGDIITLQKDSVIAIPKELISSRRMSSVYTVERNMAEEKMIRTGISDDRFIEVESGLNAGDKIVTKGYEYLRNRSRVKIMK